MGFQFFFLPISSSQRGHHGMLVVRKLYKLQLFRTTFHNRSELLDSMHCFVLPHHVRMKRREERKKKQQMGMNIVSVTHTHTHAHNITMYKIIVNFYLARYMLT